MFEKFKVANHLRSLSQLIGQSVPQSTLCSLSLSPAAIGGTEIENSLVGRAHIFDCIKCLGVGGFYYFFHSTNLITVNNTVDGAHLFCTAMRLVVCKPKPCMFKVGKQFAGFTACKNLDFHDPDGYFLFNNQSDIVSDGKAAGISYMRCCV